MTDYVFPHGPFQGRRVTSLSGAEIELGLSSCPRPDPLYAASDHALRAEQAARYTHAKEEERKRRNREARARRTQERQRQGEHARGTAPRGRATAADYLAQATPLERAQYDAAPDGKQRRRVLDQIKRRLKREAARSADEFRRAEAQARRAEEQAKRKAFVDEYRKQHPDADAWTVSAAWRKAEPRQTYEGWPFRERTNPVDRDLAMKIIAAGRRVLASKCHPDIGGDATAMTELNATTEWLEQFLRRGGVLS